MPIVGIMPNVTIAKVVKIEAIKYMGLSKVAGSSKWGGLNASLHNND